MKYGYWLGFLILLTTFAGGQDFDLLIRDGWVLDGTGNPAIRADIGLLGDRIAAMGKLEEASAARVIEANGLHVVPGFIDMHSHADRALVSEDRKGRQALNLVIQGITTIVVGADGRNAVWPVSDEIAAYRDPGTALNVVLMVGHATVRRQVMGDDYERAATPEEIKSMQALVRQGMEAGGWGLGAGPEYRPGRFSTTEEIVELARVVADYDGFYYAHQRSQSPLPLWQTPSILDAGWRLTGTDGMKETIRIGREAGIRVVGSHIKAKGPTTWGHSAIDRLLIEQARREGVQVFLDQYPYETFGGGGRGVLPNWAFAPPGTDRTGGNDDPAWRTPGLFANHKENLRRNLMDSTTGPLLRQDILYLLDMQGGADRHIIVKSKDTSLIGKTLTEVAESNRITPLQQLVEFAMQGTEEQPHGILFRPVAGHRFDVENYMQQDYTATCTDAGIILQKRPGLHPRYYGAYPRKIAHYVRERRIISLPFAIRSSTGLPAQIIGLQDRGYLREGLKADLVIFDFASIQDRATILEPYLPPEGIEFVVTNGQLTVDAGETTGLLPGQVLVRSGGSR